MYVDDVSLYFLLLSNKKKCFIREIFTPAKKFGYLYEQLFYWDQKQTFYMKYFSLHSIQRFYFFLCKTWNLIFWVEILNISSENNILMTNIKSLWKMTFFPVLTWDKHPQRMFVWKNVHFTSQFLMNNPNKLDYAEGF